MPNIKPVSGLINYGEVLKGIAFDEPVFLIRNRRCCYAIVDIADTKKRNLWDIIMTKIHVTPSAFSICIRRLSKYQELHRK